MIFPFKKTPADITHNRATATYRLLEDEETKLWHYGPVALYQIFLENH